MMSTKEQELSDWFWNKFNSCYLVKHISNPNNIYLYCDDIYTRNIKLHKINKEDIKYPDKIKGICLFGLDTKEKVLYCDENEIFNFLVKNYSTSYRETYKFINSIIIRNKKLKGYFINVMNSNKMNILKNKNDLYIIKSTI